MRCLNLLGPDAIVLTFGLALLQSSFASAFTQCYFPDGSIPTDYIWEPCTGAEYSSCCVPSEGDICQENGLCYYPEVGALYRGTCTDRTWNDPACNADICVTGYETTWDWVIECDSSGSSLWACGNVTDNTPQTATCPGSAKTEAISIQTTTTTSSAGRYTSPSPINTSLYSLYTDTYTVTMSAAAQTTTLTSVFESTLTSTLSGATSTAARPTSAAAASSTNTPASGTKRVVLTMGVIVAIIVGPTLALAIGLATFFFMRRRSRKDAVRLNSPSYPPPNGPVGADQVTPYELDLYEATNAQQKKYEYSNPRADAYEVAGEQNGFKEEKTWGRQGAMEMGGDELRSPRSPAPRYSEAVVPIELDGTSSFRVPNQR